jgi:hypothetical protein
MDAQQLLLRGSTKHGGFIYVAAAHGLQVLVTEFKAGDKNRLSGAATEANSNFHRDGMNYVGPDRGFTMRVEFYAPSPNVVTVGFVEDKPERS